MKAGELGIRRLEKAIVNSNQFKVFCKKNVFPWNCFFWTSFMIPVKLSAMLEKLIEKFHKLTMTKVHFINSLTTYHKYKYWSTEDSIFKATTIMRNSPSLSYAGERASYLPCNFATPVVERWLINEARLARLRNIDDCTHVGLGFELFLYFVGFTFSYRLCSCILSKDDFECLTFYD